MTLTTIVIYCAIAAVILTLITEFVFKTRKDWITSFFQNFTGAFFIFSGVVKAVDPLGTAYKMEKYFVEFEYTFEETWMSFIAPLFPWLSEFSVSFAVFMVVLEIVLGIMLIIGALPRLSSWVFLLLVGFFTFLTGFTYLNGHVPQGANFFEFGKWGTWVESNMKVTDCGCFGDFLKLKPKISFYKDLFLMIPAIWFMFRSRYFHTWFTPSSRSAILGLSTVGLLLYCFSNFYWDIPGQDFRPFKVGTDIPAVRQMEEDAQAAVKVVAYKMTNKKDGKVVELPYDKFLKEYKSYPKEDWEYEQIKTEPAIESTKISELSFMDADGNEMVEDILADPNYSFMIVSYRLYGEAESKEISQTVPVFTYDTIPNPDVEGGYLIEKKPAGSEIRKVVDVTYNWDEKFAEVYRKKINPFADAAQAAGFKVFGTAGEAGSTMIEEFRHDTQAAYPIYEADEILLKTIVRSNPGIVLLKNGKIIMKWHQKKLPSFEEVKATYMK